jgi:metal-responsive CopG/Arc/MetJ family transcriptional regulator
MSYIIHIRRCDMRRTTIFADDTLLNEMKHLAGLEKKSVAEVVREAMEQYIESKHKPARKLSLIGIGESERTDVAEKSEELLWPESSR